MKNQLFILLLIWVAIHIPTVLFAWECEVTVSGPNTVKLDQQITLSASGTPDGGSYSWSRTPNLTPHGSTATLIGFKPTYSEYIKVIGYYTSPKGKKCSDTKWIWACLCKISSLNGPAEAEVGQKVTLTAEADSTGGTYTWTINSGTGTLTSSGSSAEFTGDKGGLVEIKVSYAPPEGGEPCAKYHTIQVNEECEVTLTGDMYQRSVCREVDFSAEGKPSGGTCSWSGNGISGIGCNALYNGKTAGNDTVTVTYTTPGGSTCDDSKNVLSYSLDGMVSNKKCFDSGSALQQSDFDFFISPSGFTFQPILSPETVTTNQSQARILVTASSVCDPGYTNDTSTGIDVVNDNVKSIVNVELKIPKYFMTPLKKIGIGSDIEFSVSDRFKYYKECCDNWIGESKKGDMVFLLKSPTLSYPLLGFPVPKWAKRYVRADVSIAISGSAGGKLTGEHNSCERKSIWTGGGIVEVKPALTGGLKANAPNYIVFNTGAEGSTKIIEKMSVVDQTKLKITTNWSGFTGKLYGELKVPRFLIDTKIEIGKTFFSADGLLPVVIDLPTLGGES